MKRKSAYSLCILSLLLITSCGTTKLSKKEMKAVKSGKKAIVKTYNQPLMASMVFDEMPVVRIRSVDGRDIEIEMLKLDDQIALDVGPHEIEFSCQARNSDNERDYAETIKVDLKAGHEYLVRCSFDTDLGPDGTYTGSFSVKEQKIK